MKRIQNLHITAVLLSALITAGCSVQRITGRITSGYAGSNSMIEGTYTHFFNDSLKISEDLYSGFEPGSKAYSISGPDFSRESRIIEKKLGVLPGKGDFVFRLTSGALYKDKHALATTMYYLKGRNAGDRLIQSYRKGGRIYRIYSLANGDDGIIQVFSASKRLRKNRDLYENFNKEGDATIRMLCYGNYYKISYWDLSKIAIDLTSSDFHTRNIKKEMLSDPWILQTQSKKIISIPDNRESVSITFRLSGHAADAVTGKIPGHEAFVAVYSRSELMKDPLAATPVIRIKPASGRFILNIDISFNDYVLLVEDNSSNIHEAFCLNIW